MATASEKYIDHEVRIRVHDERFKQLEDIVKETRNFTRALLGAALTVIIVPVVLHYFGLV